MYMCISKQTYTPGDLKLNAIEICLLLVIKLNAL